MGRQYDSLARKSYARLVELLPGTPWAHYNQGLFFKTRGHFSEGVEANKKAIKLAEESNDSYQWNLGICATGSGQAEEALNIWKEIGQKIELGRFDLPEGGYPSCKIRLAEHPLSERDANNDDPELEETIWIERLSPCHGIIRSVLYKDLGVDYGDVILFDGAPITYHKYGDQQIAVFPHISTLKRNNYQFFDFAGTQETKGELGDISSQLEKDAVIYSHTENYSILCSTCWHDEKIDHEHKVSEEKNVVTGRIAVPPDIKPKTILKIIDNSLKDTPESRVFSPDLCRAAGLEDRARIEERRYNLLWNTVE
jgi:tetratricopeptide (TPR) repeat protein